MVPVEVHHAVQPLMTHHTPGQAAQGKQLCMLGVREDMTHCVRLESCRCLSNLWAVCEDDSTAGFVTSMC